MVKKLEKIKATQIFLIDLLFLLKEFPLYQLKAVWMDLKRYIKNISPERIVILHLEGDAVMGLRNATQIISSLGSILVDHLDKQSIWTLVFSNGGKTFFEKITSHKHVKTQQKTSSHLWLPLSPIPMPLSQPFSKEAERWKYCAMYGVMGDLCDESFPANLTFPEFNTFLDPNLESMPIIITGGNRPIYLYQSLKSYLKAPGSIKRNFHILLGTLDNSTSDLLKLLNISFTYLHPSTYGQKKFVSFAFYRKVYQYVYENYKDTEYVIFLEEDVEVAQDFFMYIKHVLPLLKKDKTLYCIAGFSDTGLLFLAYNESVLQRASVQVGWGYVVSMEFIEEALIEWSLAVVFHEKSVYDAFLYNMVRGNRECILPAVSRTRHFGMGINTDYFTAEKSFLTMPLAKSRNVTYTNIESLLLPNWKSDLQKQIVHSILISSSINVCEETFLETLPHGSYVLYYNYSKNTDNATFVNYFTLSNCFRAFPFSLQGQHEFVKIFRLSPRTILYLIADPESPYSKFRPPSQTPFDIHNLSQEDYAIYMWGTADALALVYMEYKIPISQNIMSVFH